MQIKTTVQFHSDPLGSVIIIKTTYWQEYGHLELSKIAIRNINNVSILGNNLAVSENVKMTKPKNRVCVSPI